MHIFVSITRLRRIYLGFYIPHSPILWLAWVYEDGLQVLPLVFVVFFAWREGEQVDCAGVLAATPGVWPFFLQDYGSTTSPWEVPFRWIRTFCTYNGTSGRVRRCLEGETSEGRSFVRRRDEGQRGTRREGLRKKYNLIHTKYCDDARRSLRKDMFTCTCTTTRKERMRTLINTTRPSVTGRSIRIALARPPTWLRHVVPRDRTDSPSFAGR